MTTCEYDLDTSGRLMDEIQKLIAPPASDDAMKRQQCELKEYKKHGKAMNRDYCDSCQEGGDLVCCDRFPMSFHLQCHNPPLEEEDIPQCEFVCHRCKIAPQKKDDDDIVSSKSSSSSNGISLKCSQPPMPSPILSVNPLRTLAEAAQQLNPVQFDLLQDVECHTSLPGSYKRKWWGRDKNMPQKKPAHELDNGLVPLPAKLCFVCNRSCRVAPLLPCDYCPCYFHLDCLNPPMASVPTERWMCPNHVEKVMDEKLSKTAMLTERVKLWDKYNNRVNQHTVKMTFLQKAHHRNPHIRLMRQLPQRNSAAIPPAIKDFYQHPTGLLMPPTLNVGGGNRETFSNEQITSEISFEEQEQWLRSVVSLQTSIAQFLAKKQLEHKPEKPTASVHPVLNRDFANQSVTDTNVSGNLSNEVTSKNGDQHVPNGSPVTRNDAKSHLDISKGAVSLLNSLCNSFNGDVDINELGHSSKSDSGIVEQLNVVRVWPGGGGSDKQSLVSNGTQTSSGGRNVVISTVNKTNNVYTRVVPGIPGKVAGQTSILTPRAVNQAGKIGSVVLKTNVNSPSNSCSKMMTLNQSLAAPKLAISQNCKQQRQAPPSGTNQASSVIISLNNTLQQCLDGAVDLELTKLDEKLIQILAWQRLQQLAPLKSCTDSSRKISGCINGLVTMPGLQEVQARAVLCPLSGKGDSISMPYRTLSIGAGADMDVCLGQYRQCNFISAKHAFIFYDELSKHYELLNYSEHGTTVDNVLYSCDFSDKPASMPQPSAVVAAVRHLNSTLKPKMKADERLTLSSRSSDTRVQCNCKGSSSSLIGSSGAGWEGTAILHHGSYIKVGCIQFVFSIIDYATLHPIHGVKREPMSLLKSHLKGVP